MKVVTVCREIPANTKTHNYPFAEFIYEQNKSLERLGVKFDYYLIKSGGYKNYINQARDFRNYLKENNYKYDIIHSHGGHVGSITNFQRKIPVVTTYHGSDINNRFTRLISMIALFLSRENIFVSSKLLNKVQKYANGSVIPCGIDLDIFKPLDKIKCRNELGFKETDKILLFAGNSEKKVKNYKLAQSAIKLIDQNHLIIELKKFKREEVNLLLNAADVLLLTSLTEGSPQVIKEAMACNCPIVATDVGDVSEIINGTEGCFISSFNPADVAKKIILALNYNKTTNGRDRIKSYDNQLIAKGIYQIYMKITLK